MRRSMNGTRNGTSVTSSAPKQVGGSSMSRRSTAADENCNNKSGQNVLCSDDNTNAQAAAAAGPVTARLKMLEKKFSQILEVQAKFGILDKWIQQQFSIKLFPPAVVHMDKFSEGNPEDADNPFYAVYLLCQRVKFLEEKVKKLEARPFEDIPEPKPTSNYSSAHAFRNMKGHGKASGGGGPVKRAYTTASPTTPKKPKLIPRPVPPSSNYPFKPSVKILPKDPNASPMKKETLEQPPSKASAPTKPADESENKVQIKDEPGESTTIESNTVAGANIDVSNEAPPSKDNSESKERDSELMEVDQAPVTADQLESKETEKKTTDEDEKVGEQASIPSAAIKVEDAEITMQSQETKINQGTQQEVSTAETLSFSESASASDSLPVLQDATALVDEAMNNESGQDDVEEEVEQKPILSLEEEVGGGDVSGSEASVSSLASSSSKPRQSTRRRQAAVAAASSSSSASGKQTEEDKPVMYTARGRRHTVPRRYAEFTGHDNVVSILKSQQRAEKAAALTAAGTSGTSKGGKRQSVTPTKSLDTPPKIKKMVKTAKTPSPKKITVGDNEADGEGSQGKKKSSQASVSNDRPPCVDVLVDRVMGREVDSDGMVVLSELYPNIYVNQQQLVTVIIRSNGKSTRLTRKMTTLVFEDSVLASASPFGTKYYKDRLPPEPLEAMVDFIAESGFEPHYSKKKIYMIVGQVCNEARAGRVSRKFMQPLENTPGTSTGSQSVSQETNTASTSPSSCPLSQPQTLEPVTE